MVRRLVHVLVIVLTLVVGATAAAVITSQTAWFKDRLRGYIERQATQYLNGRFSIQRLGGNIFFGVELENVGVSMEGSEVVAVKNVGLDYNLFQLIARGLSVDNIRLNQPVLYLRRDGDAWSISRLIKRDRAEADRQGPARPITIDGIDITDGSVVIEDAVGTSGVAVPARVDRLDAKLSFQYEPVRYSIDFAHVSFRASEPSIALNALSGGLSVHDDSIFVDKLALRTTESSLLIEGAIENYLATPIYKVQITADKFSLPEWGRVIPALSGTPLEPAFELKTNGPLDQLNIDLSVRSDAGQLRGTVVADLMTPGHSVNGTLSVHKLDLAPIVNQSLYRSDITGAATIDARLDSFGDVDSLNGHLDLNAPRIAAAGFIAEQVQAKADFHGRDVVVDGKAIAYGASATAAGRVALPGESGRVAFDLRGQTRNLDLRRLPGSVGAPAAATNIAADYHAAGSAPVGGGAPDVRVDARFLPSVIAGAKVGGGSTATVAVKRGAFDSGRGIHVSYAVDADVSGVDLQRIGEEFKVPALARSRYASALNGHVVASGDVTTPRQMTLQASGTLHESSIVGGRIPDLAFEATLSGDTAAVKARGRFADVDPAVASGEPAMKGSVGGTLDVDATLQHVSRGVTPESVRATGIINLDSSTIGGLQVTRATVDGDYEHSTGVIRTFDVAGRELNLRASGTLALNDTGQSNLTVHADSPSLDEIGGLLNRPLGGVGSVDATVTGNRRELVATGKLTGGGVRYGDTNALSVTSDFSATVPDLDVARARFKATTQGTFVSIAGQEINELSATTEYDNRQLRFEGAATQPQRSLGAAGHVVLHPDHQEIHLQRLSLQSQGIAWATAAGTEPAIRYAPDTVAIRDLRLVNGDQLIAADGSFGRPGDALKVTLDNIDLATVDALMLQPQRFSGRLDASGTVTGSRSAPSVEADFTVVQGGFREFQYDRFAGTVTYSGKGLQLDTRMDQAPASWLTAKGYAPATLFRRTAAPPGEASADHAKAVSPEDRVDLRIDSSPIGLGIVQGFAPRLSNVTGTVEAHVHVTGTGEDPHPSGSVTFNDGAFTVDDIGVTYSNLRGEVLLQPDRIRLDNLYVLDNHDSFLSLSGELAVHERQVGDVQLFVTARDFKVIDNNLGNVRLTSDLEVTGELRAPQIVGDLSVTTGQINLDEIVAVTSDSAYSTEPTEFLEAPPAEAEPSASRLPLLDAVRMNVRVSIPDDLIVKAASLETPGSPIGAGAFTITLGGDLQVTREPASRPVLLGSVNTVRGFYDFQGRRFTILRDGTIRFVGGDELDPLLDLRAERVIRAVTTNVNVRGTLKRPAIVLSSMPPLEQADIMALIVFNQPVNELAEGQQISLAQRAQAVAAGAATGALQRSISRALNIDEFAINLAPESGDLAALTVGQQIGQNLWVKVEQGLGITGQTNFVLEYSLTDWLRLNTNVLQGSTTQQQLFQRMQGSGVDLLFFFSY